MDKRTIDRIRGELDLPWFIEDERIAEVFGGSFTEARVNLALALEGLREAFKAALPSWARRKS